MQTWNKFFLQSRFIWLLKRFSKSIFKISLYSVIKHLKKCVIILLLNSSQTGANTGKFLSVKIYGLEFVISLIFENCENNRFRYAITVWFFDKTERERAKEESALEGNSVRINLSPMIAVILLSGTTIVL